jgi:predicted transposase YbfD/YdcC
MSQSIEPSSLLLEHFKHLEDPQAEHLLEHQLLDIIGLTICAVVCGADSWVDIEHYGKAKQDWLKGFLKLTNGVPSHDTIARLFAALKPEALQECFLSWVKAIAGMSTGDIIAIDRALLQKKE